MTSIFQKALQNVISIIDALIIACGDSDTLEEARMLAHTLLEEISRGSPIEETRLVYALTRIRELLIEARSELEESGCLDAYRIDDAIAELDSVIGPLQSL